MKKGHNKSNGFKHYWFIFIELFFGLDAEPKTSKGVKSMNVVGVYGISNNASLNIYQVIYGTDDYVVAGTNSDKPRKYKLYTNAKGYYFNFGKTKYYLSEFMRA